MAATDKSLRMGQIGQIEQIADQLRAIGGLVGVVLGGSCAGALQGPKAELELGLYYATEKTLDLQALAAAAQALDDQHRPNLIVPPSGWGPWVNGGGWLQVDGLPVDFLLRDIGRVEQSIAECQAGTVHAHYQSGHPHAYLNAMYAGELAIAHILVDPSGRLQELQDKALPYPPALKQALIRFFDFEAGFSLMLAKNQIYREEAYYVAAHLVRSLSCLNQVLFAINEVYCINEKKAVLMIDGFEHKPQNYKLRVDTIIALAGNENHAACRELTALLDATRHLL